MLNLIIYFLCVYIVFKGVEIFQIALMSPRQDRKLGLIIGVLAVIGALATATLFGYIAVTNELDMMRRMENFPRL